MNNNIKIKLLVVTLIVVVLSPIFYCNKVMAVTDDDGPDVTDSSIDWQFTCYGGENLGGTGFTESDFSTNDKYGWCEYVKDGVTYVVLAAATHELLNSGEVGESRYDYIHYFNYYDTIQFKFVDENFDSNTYNGIILDSCGASMNPTKFNHASNVQVLDVYFKASTYNEAISGKSVKITMDGTFSQGAGTESSKSGKGKKVADFFNTLFNGIGDFLVILQDTLGTTLSADDVTKLTYTKSDMEEQDYFKDEIDVGTANQSDLKKQSDNETTKNVLTTKTISDKIDNKSGMKETVFSSDTEIPAIPIDAYSATIGKVKFFDIKFFDKSYDNGDDNWKFFRGVVSTVSHIILYVSAILLFTMIIIRALLLVLSTMKEEPEGARDAKEVMDSVLKAVLIIGYCYLFMALFEYLYEELLQIFIAGNDSRYLIRLVVDGLYSFNTNIVGYFKYMSMMSNYTAVVKYSAAYAAISVVNFVWFFYMVVRMFIVALMIMFVPLTAVYELSGKTQRRGFHLDNLLKWETFMRIYLIFVFSPLVIIGIYRFSLIIWN